MTLTTHTLHTHLARLRREAQRLQKILAAVEAVTEAAGQAAPKSALARQLYAGRRAVRHAKRALPLVQRQAQVAAHLAYEIEAQSEIGGMLDAQNLHTVTQMLTLTAGEMDDKRLDSVLQSLDRMLGLLTRPAASVPAPRPARAPQLAAARPGTRVRVERVVDGDTIIVTGGWRVRYIGMDTPEMCGPGGEPERYAREATRANEKLVGGKTVSLRKDKSETDRYGRLLRYVYAGGIFVNAELVKRGYAYALSMSPDTRHAELFEELEGEARRKRRGMWKEKK